MTVSGFIASSWITFTDFSRIGRDEIVYDSSTCSGGVVTEYGGKSFSKVLYVESKRL